MANEQTTNKRDWMFGATGSGKTSFDEFRKMFPSPVLFELRPRKAGVMEQSLRDLFASDEDYEHYLRMREENQNG